MKEYHHQFYIKNFLKKYIQPNTNATKPTNRNTFWGVFALSICSSIFPFNLTFVGFFVCGMMVRFRHELTNYFNVTKSLAVSD